MGIQKTSTPKMYQGVMSTRHTLTIECNMCDKRAIARYYNKDSYSEEWSKSEFGVFYSECQGYMSPHDNETVEFVICWDCLKSKVRAKFTDHTPPEMYMTDEEIEARENDPANTKAE